MTLREACAALLRAKEAEARARDARLEAEDILLDLIGELPPEGSNRREDGPFVAVITKTIRRTFDEAKLREISHQIPDEIGRRLVRWKPEINVRELKYVRDNEPELYAVVAQAVEAKPAKPSVAVIDTRIAGLAEAA